MSTSAESMDSTLVSLDVSLLSGHQDSDEPSFPSLNESTFSIELEATQSDANITATSVNVGYKLVFNRLLNQVT